MFIWCGKRGRENRLDILICLHQKCKHLKGGVCGYRTKGEKIIAKRDKDMQKEKVGHVEKDKK